jgi:ubiquinone biosynthesis protein
MNSPREGTHRGNRRILVAELIGATGMDDVIPDQYSRFRPIVRDGVAGLLAGLSADRFARLVRSQFGLPRGATASERLLNLAGQLPTLQKLGQVIARNPNVDSSFRAFLVRLEQGPPDSATGDMDRRIRTMLGERMQTFRVALDDVSLSAGSVAVVLPFTSRDPLTGRRKRGVFKLLKPGIADSLEEELGLMDEFAVTLERHGSDDGLNDFRFVETFRDIAEALRCEIRFEVEQQNLRRAAETYAAYRGIEIPRLVPELCTPHLTAMAFQDGMRITDQAALRGARAARSLFEALIAAPLFAPDEFALFHGDPHAGNLFSVERDPVEPATIALLDWSQAGILTRAQRHHIVHLALDLFNADETAVFDRLRELSSEPVGRGHPMAAAIGKEIHRAVAGSAGAGRGLFERLFGLLDGVALAGLRFPADFLLYRKAFFTLRGVLLELDPDFDFDAAMTAVLGRLVINEWPRRWSNLLVPWLERREHYPSTLTNADLSHAGFRLWLQTNRRLVAPCAR